MNVKEEIIQLKTNDGVRIALWKIYPKKGSRSKQIFLTHGTFSNKKICLGIAKYFANLGYTCWILEWRNHGNSERIKGDFDFETIGTSDIKTSFNYLINTLHIPHLNCITHSGGGIALIIFLQKNKEFIEKINSITMFACQVFGAGNSTVNYLKILIGKHFTRFLGYIPSKILKLGEHNEPYYFMKQWFNWNLKRNFIGNNGFDYRKNMKLIKIPILSICAKGDIFIAPKEGCELFFNEFENPNNKFIVCSKENGFNEDYNHSRIILSKNASKEVWNHCLNWITKNSKNPL